MSAVARLRELADRIAKMRVDRFSERETERYLVEPFLDALGYDSRDPEEVQSQIPIQIGSATRNCDFAVKLNGEVKFLIECKKPGVNLDSPGQLASYFSQVDALFGIYTNGVEYRFYAERNQGRFKRMDSEPFLTLDLSNPDESAVGSAARCSKDQLGDADRFRRWVEDLRCTRVISDRLHRELTGQPSEAFVRLAMGWAGVEDQTLETVGRFSALVKDAAHSILNARPSQLKALPQDPGQDDESRLTPQQFPVASATEWVPLDQVPDSTHKPAPVAIRLPDGERPLGTWRGVLAETACWLIREGVLTRENCQVMTKSKRTLFSLDGRHPGGATFKRPVALKDTGIIMEGNLSAREAVRHARGTLSHFGKESSLVHLKLQSS